MLLMEAVVGRSGIGYGKEVHKEEEKGVFWVLFAFFYFVLFCLFFILSFFIFLYFILDLLIFIF